MLEDNPTDAEIVQRVLKKEKFAYESTVVIQPRPDLIR
jgi:hypothetical protein